MRLSLRWIGRHVDLEGLEAPKIAEDLTLVTAEVEGCERFDAGLGAAVVGEVLERRTHPKADRLVVARVGIGASGTLEIVCGARNVEAGQKVAVAPPGAALPDGTRIDRASVRGVESSGMILSEKEMGIGSDAEGIAVLDSSARPGSSVAEALGLLDWVLEIDNKSITHRPDLWGHRGFAREIAAIYERSLRPSAKAPPWPSGTPFRVEVEDEALCPLYLALPVEGLRFGPSPAWLRNLLLAAGQRPIANAVDLTNFVMLDLGEPTHAFDRRRLRGDRIVVRRARKGERHRTLDGVDRVLGEEDLMIADAERAVGIAGVMGGAESEIGPETRSLALECASFDPVSVRRTAQRQGLRTEASSRFEKSLDPGLADEACALFATLLPEVCPGAAPVAPPTRVGSAGPRTREVLLRPARAREKLGVAIPTPRMGKLLGRLGFGVETRGEDLEVTVPSWRATKDVTIEEDLVEEVGRMHGYGRIAEAVPSFPAVPAPRDDESLLAGEAADLLALAFGFREAYAYTFLQDDAAEATGVASQPFVRVRNPIAEGLSRIRRELLPSLLALLPKNLREFDEVRLFEVGKGYRPEAPNARGEPLEVHEAAAVWADRRAPEEGFDKTPFARAKGVLEGLLSRLGIADAAATPWPDGEKPPYLHAARAVRLGVAGKPVGFAGEVDAKVRRALGLEASVGLLSLDLRAVLHARSAGKRFAPIPRFPAVKVDVALALPESVPFADALEALRAAGEGRVRDATLFDLYRGPAVGDGRKSLAFHVTLVDPARTLEAADEARFLERVRETTRALGGELRTA